MVMLTCFSHNSRCGSSIFPFLYSLLFPFAVPPPPHVTSRPPISSMPLSSLHFLFFLVLILLSRSSPLFLRELIKHFFNLGTSAPLFVSVCSPLHWSSSSFHLSFVSNFLSPYNDAYHFLFLPTSEHSQPAHIRTHTQGLIKKRGFLNTPLVILNIN